MVRALPVLILVACIIYTIVHVVQSNSERVRRLPKSLWLVVVIFLPVFGMIAWWIFGRPLDGPLPPTMAPDDDPDFLRNL